MIHLDVRDRVATLVLDRPPVNAFAARIQGLFPGWEQLPVPALAVLHGAATGTGPAQPAIKQCVARAASAEGYASETASQRALHASAEAGTPLRAFLAERRGR